MYYSILDFYTENRTEKLAVVLHIGMNQDYVLYLQKNDVLYTAVVEFFSVYKIVIAIMNVQRFDYTYVMITTVQIRHSI